VPTIIRTTPDVLLLAVRDKLKTALGWPLERLYIATLEVPPVNVQADQYATIRMMGLNPVKSIIHGAGRVDYRVQMPVAITISSRADLDDIAQQIIWLTDLSLGHLKFEVAIINALGCIWFEDAAGNGYLYEDIILERGDVPKLDKKESGWGQSTLTFSLDFVLDLDQTVQ